VCRGDKWRRWSTLRFRVVRGCEEGKCVRAKENLGEGKIDGAVAELKKWALRSKKEDSGKAEVFARKGGEAVSRMMRRSVERGCNGRRG